MTDSPRARWSEWLSAVSRGGALGAGAGFCAALSDVASTAGWLSGSEERTRLVIALALAGAGAGAWIGTLIAVVFATRNRPPTTRNTAICTAALVALPLGAVAWWLFTGGRARHVPALAVVRPVTWIALVALATAVVVSGSNIARAARSSRLVVRVSAVVSFVLVAQILHAMDHRVLPRLYEYLHTALGVSTALAFAGALYVGAPRTSSTRRVWLSLPVLLACAPLAFMLLDRWDNVRAEVFGVHAPFVRHAVLAIESLRPRPTRPHPDHTTGANHTLDLAGLPSRPGASVLLITIDALRNDRIGRMVDGQSLTPHLDALAAEGTRFDRTYAQAPHSSYSITSLHTSEYLHETVPLGQRQPLWTLADRFDSAGYYTAAFYTNGIFFTEGERLTVYRDRTLGFRRADHVDRRANAQAEAAMREIDDVVRRGEPPTFLWVHFFDTHEPYGGEGSTPEARYDAAVHAVDAAVGTLVSYARTHLARELVLAVTADHGEEFGEHGGVYHGSSLYEEQVRVPLVIAGAGVAHATIGTAAQLIDVAPTLLGAVGIAAANSMHGDDLRAVIAGRAAHETTAFAAVNTRSMVTDGRYKLIVDRRYGVRELFDLARDPRETVNLASSDRADGSRLDMALDAWSDETGARATGRAVLARGRMGDRGVLPEVLALARDPGASIAQRIEAMDALAGYDDPAATSPLRTLLDDRTRQIADAAAVALGRSGHFEAHARLLDAIERDDPDARGVAAIALANLRDPAAVPSLTELLYTGNETQRIEAVDALGSLGLREGLPAIEEMLADDHLRYRAVLSLGRIGGPDVLDRVARIARDDRADDVRANAGAALALSNDRSQIATLRRLAIVDGAQRYAASALARLGAALYDARNDSTRSCGPLDDSHVWHLLGARICEVPAPLTLSARGAHTPTTLIVRARGTTTLRITDGTNEIAHIDLEPTQREWRITLPSMPAALTLHADAPFALAHVVAIP